MSPLERTHSKLDAKKNKVILILVYKRITKINITTKQQQSTIQVQVRIETSSKCIPSQSYNPYISNLQHTTYIQMYKYALSYFFFLFHWHSLSLSIVRSTYLDLVFSLSLPPSLSLPLSLSLFIVLMISSIWDLNRLSLSLILFIIVRHHTNSIKLCVRFKNIHFYPMRCEQIMQIWTCKWPNPLLQGRDYILI